jgi:hypothetical protein
MTSVQLEAIGIQLAGHRKKLLMAIEKIPDFPQGIHTFLLLFETQPKFDSNFLSFLLLLRLSSSFFMSFSSLKLSQEENLKRLR